MRPNTRLLYAETPANPHTRLTDLEALGQLALELDPDAGAAARGGGEGTDAALREHRKVWCAVDATFSSPRVQRVLEIPGIDVSIHAGTKYLAGHSDLTAGTVTCADGAFVDRLARGYRLLGGALDAFSAFLLHRGAKTLDARMEPVPTGVSWNHADAD